MDHGPFSVAMSNYQSVEIWHVYLGRNQAPKKLDPMHLRLVLPGLNKNIRILIQIRLYGFDWRKNSKVQSVMEGIHPHFHIWTIFYPHNPPISNIHHSQRIHPNIHPNIVPIYQEAARKQIVCFSRVDKSCFNSVCSCRRLRTPLVAGSRIWEWWVIYWAVLNLKQQGTYGPRSIII